MMSPTSSRRGLLHICSHSVDESVSCGQAWFQQSRDVYFSHTRPYKSYGEGRETKVFSHGEWGTDNSGKECNLSQIVIIW